MATTILLLRHAEKHQPGDGEAGVDAFGQRDRRGLTARGWQRAGALVRWIVPVAPGVRAPIAPPAAIFAAAPAKPQWREDAFDRAWFFTRTRGRWQLRELAQNLLPGDTETIRNRK